MAVIIHTRILSSCMQKINLQSKNVFFYLKFESLNIIWLNEKKINSIQLVEVIVCLFVKWLII